MHRILSLLLFLQVATAYSQSCSSLNAPRDGAIDVPVDTPIRWSEVLDPIGYVVSLGTTPGGSDIINNRSSGLRNFYIPETGLPADTQIYVEISYYKAGQDYTTCEVETFRTAALTSPPDCTILSEPLNGGTNIAAETKLKWNYAPTATGYLLSVGTSLGESDVFDTLDVGNVLEFDPPEGLPADIPVYVTIVPYNQIGIANSCAIESFTTTSAVIDCGPIFDYKTGELVSLSPEIDFPGVIGFCKDKTSIHLKSIDNADGYRWYALNDDGSEILLSSTISVELSSIGNYRYEAYNEVTRSASTVECANSMTFSLIASESAVVTSIDDRETAMGRRLEVNISGEGNYEYALDNSEGPYQDSPVFEDVTSDFHYIYVRDKNGCEITESSVQRNLDYDDFPKFFTPNGDNINDYWQFIAPKIENEIVLTTIEIFNRYGTPIAIIDPKSKGWDGTFRGRQMPSSDYWFKATARDGQVVRGHFSLKR